MTEQATSLDEAIDGVKEPETPVAEPEPTQEAAQPEPSEPSEPTQPEPTPQQPAPEMVPVGVVQELRRELRELKQAAAPKPQAPEFIDPEGAEYLGKQMAAMQANFQAELSEVKARAVHGDEKVNAALKAAEEMGILDRFRGIQDPWGNLTKWHQQQQVIQEVGDDPSAYKAKLEAEIRAKVEAEMVAKQAAAVAGTPAPSLANATGTGGGPKTTWTGPTPLSNILGD